MRFQTMSKIMMRFMLSATLGTSSSSSESTLVSIRNRSIDPAAVAGLDLRRILRVGGEATSAEVSTLLRIGLLHNHHSIHQQMLATASFVLKSRDLRTTRLHRITT